MTTLPDCDIYLTKSGEGIRHCPLGTLPPAGGGEDPAEDFALRSSLPALRNPSRRYPPSGEKKLGTGTFFWKVRRGWHSQYCEKFVRIL